MSSLQQLSSISKLLASGNHQKSDVTGLGAVIDHAYRKEHLIRRRFLHVLLQRPRSDLCPIDISLSIGGHAFGGAGSRRLFDRIGDEVLDGAILCTPDTYAALPTIMVS